MIRLRRVIAIFTLLLSTLSIAILTIFYGIFTRVLPSSFFYLIIIFSSILFFALLIFFIPVHDLNEQKQLLRLKISKYWLYLVVLSIFSLYIYSLFLDFIVLNTIFYSTIILMIGLTTSTCLIFTRASRLAIFLTLFFFLSYIVFTYAFYPPSHGIDTWRDSEIALQTLRSGHITGVTNSSYQIPIVSLLYVMISLTLNITPVNASALMGLIYV